MFACIHASADPLLLLECAQAFSPVVEQTAADIALLDASGLDRIYGDAHEMAAAIDRRARELGFAANIALASNPDAAICAARGFSGISIVPCGDEAKFLESLPLELLVPGEEMLETLERWGIRTFRDLAVLPAIGIAGRLGPEGVRLQQLARGEFERPLRPLEDPLRFEEDLELEYPVELLEPLSFVLAPPAGRSLPAPGIARAGDQRGSPAPGAGGQIGARAHAAPARAHARSTHVFEAAAAGSGSASAGGAGDASAAWRWRPVKPRVAQNGLFIPLRPSRRSWS